MTFLPVGHSISFLRGHKREASKSLSVPSEGFSILRDWKSESVCKNDGGFARHRDKVSQRRDGI
jgi:hypothetical protein